MYTRCLGFALLIVASIPLATAAMAERVDQNGVIYFGPEQSVHEVVMYGVPDCGYCRQARRYFTGHGIDFVEYNINRSSRRMKEFRRLGGRGTPLILIDGKKIHGFKPQAIKAALN
ncbi:MAG: glutaredoxin domain-containing protein [Pseudomonadota bacterium]